MKQLSVSKIVGVAFAVCIATAIASPAQTLTTLHNFTGTEGASPYYSPLVPGRDGNYYGTTFLGGTNQGGTVYKMTPGGTVTGLYNFCSQQYCTDGSSPYSGLTMGNDGNFYGPLRWRATPV